MAFNQHKSSTKKGERNLAQTPWYLVRQIEQLLGWTFLLDVCAQPATTKAPWFYGAKRSRCAQQIGVDCFKRDWRADLERLTAQHYAGGGAYIQPAAWMNPEFEDAEPFVACAADWAARGVNTCALVNHCAGTGWWRDIVRPHATFTLMPDGRIEYLRPDSKPFMTWNKSRKRWERSGVNFYSVLPVFTPVRPPGGAVEIPFALAKPGRIVAAANDAVAEVAA